MRVSQHLSVRLVLVAVLPILLISIALSLPMIDLRRDQVREQAQSRVVQAGRTIETIVGERMTFAVQLTELLAERVVLVQNLADGNRLNVQIFVRETREHTLFDLVTVIDRDGDVLVQDGAVALFRPQARGSAGIHVWAGAEHGLVVQVSQPILHQNQPIGTLVGNVALNDALLTGMRERTELDQRLLVGGQVVASSLPTRSAAVLAPETAPAGLAQLWQQASPQTLEVHIDGVPYLARYKPLHGPDGAMIGMAEVLLPLAPVHAAQARSVQLSLLVTLLAVCAAMLLSWILSRWITTPIQRLALVAAAIGKRRMHGAVQVRGPAEVVALGEALERMRQQLGEAQRAIEEEKERYARILETIDEAVLTLDGAGCVTSLNRRAEELLGLNRDAMQQPLNRVLLLATGEGAALTDVPVGSSTRLALRVPGGQTVTVDATRMPLPTRHPAAGEQLLVLRDVGEAVAVGALREQFLANITHEFQTPLAALMASLELLDDDDLTPTERRSLLATVQSGAQRLHSLVRNLLDNASIQAGYFRVTPEPSPLGPLIREAVELMQPLIRHRQQSIVVQQPANLPLVCADGRRVVQVLVNLLSNAHKFGPPGDRLAVTVTPTAEVVWIGVSDHGPGIPPVRQAHLFERFLRPGAETVRAQGAGLGLTIVKAIVAQHGGQVRVTSEATGGTSFAFSLPRAVPPNEQEQAYESVVSR
jgi:signal transduction histidine kinase